MADETCGHEGCDCAPREDGYCSDYCAENEGHAGHDHACLCGHTECHEAPAAAT